MIKAIIFDFYGIFYPDFYWGWLSKTVPDLESKKEIFRNFSNQIDSGKIDDKEFLQKVSDYTGISVDSMKSGFNREVMDIDHAVVELVHNLRKSYKIALLSNAYAPWLRKTLNENNLTLLFDEIIISSEVQAVKPGHKIFEIALHRLGFKKTEVLFIDDKESNTKASEKFGIKSILYTGAANLQKELEQLTGTGK